MQTQSVLSVKSVKFVGTLSLCLLSSVLCRPSSAQERNTQHATRNTKYVVSCPHCDASFHLTPTLIVTNGGRSVEGGLITERTLTFTCPATDCAEEFTAKNEKFHKIPTATEAVAKAPRPIPPDPPPLPELSLVPRRAVPSDHVPGWTQHTADPAVNYVLPRFELAVPAIYPPPPIPNTQPATRNP